MSGSVRVAKSIGVSGSSSRKLQSAARADMSAPGERVARSDRITVAHEPAKFWEAIDDDDYVRSERRVFGARRDQPRTIWPKLGAAA